MFTFKFINSGIINHAKTLCNSLTVLQKSIRHCTVRRALLYVPGNERLKIEKAFTYSADCIALELDVCDEERRAAATGTVTEFLNEGNVTKVEPECCIKINSIQSTMKFQSDMDVILSCKNLPPAIILPGVDCCEHLEIFAEYLWKKLLERPEDDRGPINLLLLISSPKAFVYLSDICKKLHDLATMAPIVPSALIFDCETYLSLTGSTRSEHRLEIMYVRQKLVVVAKAFGMQAIDKVSLNPQTSGDPLIECREGVSLGYTGKQVKHPNHIGIVQSEFIPSRSKIVEASKTIERIENMVKEKEAAMFDRLPIDLAALKVAKYTMEVAKAAGKIESGSPRKIIIS
ncbi:UNVERIFIED_CONTAM: hypothetical protein PYX00_002978 [Menopon gallinae]|uniref:HpcH/HpaI aldolase/citrate lyase domain-containing protein n=1 Tax=Menopon gallinae TaxID=328185 RepID=A0AAW2HZ19_9NEOP